MSGSPGRGNRSGLLHPNCEDAPPVPVEKILPCSQDFDRIFKTPEYTRSQKASPRRGLTSMEGGVQ